MDSEEINSVAICDGSYQYIDWTIHQLVEQALNTSSGKRGDVITLKIHIVAIVEDQ